ncbi:MAG: type IV secretion system DNA-binding domain-containing protein [Oscillospiraceae bacterium]|nr:type IV secretion system DNA-binding domain-containing protein [Oscillospiraceae bacterium]
MITHKQALYGNFLEQCRYRPSGEPPRYFFKDASSALTVAVDEPTVFKNILLLGGAGSGKTNVMNQIVAQARRWADAGGEDSISLIFDTKADYISHPGFFRPGDIVIANDRAHRSRSAVWNLFLEVLADGPDPRDYESNAREIAAVYFRDRGSQTQPFFAKAARDLFAATLIYFIRRRTDSPAAWKDNLNNEFLTRFLLHYDARQLMKFFSLYPDLQGLSSYVGDGTSHQALGVMAELRSMVYECFQGSFAGRARAGQQEFSIRQAVRKKGGRAVFILYDLSVGESLAPVYRLLIDLALKEALGGQPNGRVHLFLDELKLLPRLQHLEDALNFGRSKRVSVVAGLQSVSQIHAAYGEDVGQDILAGFGSVFTFRLNDASSRRYVSELYGTNLTAYRYQNAGGQQLDREREGHTVEDWDLMQLQPGHAVVGLASQELPFPFYFMRDPAST